MQPNEPKERSSQFSKQSETFVNNSEKDSTNKHDEAREKQERTQKYKAMQRMKKDFKSSVNTGNVLRRCENCGKFLQSVSSVCSSTCAQAVEEARLATLNKEEEDVVY
jgi:hypothetical protein